MSREVIHPSVEPEEVVNVVNNLRNDPQSRDPEKADDAKKEECIERLVNKSDNYELTEDDVVEFINEYKEIQYKGAEEVDDEGDHHFWKRLRIICKEEVEEFDANNEKMKKRLAKEDKTKRVEIENQWTGQRR
ncbi:hypothetical protein GLOIN_2v1870117 [Rhizophagus irregularis DAOM 181602=DAOM 197198]|nr:hypothetical protein GLOIN_2v1870117 [Rhizophagus irregularis DAOM 181602=DAOM 197198]